MEKGIIGIVLGIWKDSESGSDRDYANVEYAQAIVKAGGVPIMLPAVWDEDILDSYLSICDGFLFTGGVDIAPQFYGEEPHAKLGATSEKLDRFQIPLMKKVITEKKPVLGICRGSQVMNVACGGTLHQDIYLSAEEGIGKHVQVTNRGEASHTALFSEGAHLRRIFGEKAFINSYHHQSVKQPGKGVKIAAKAYDDIIEAIEVETVPFAVGVQWHPELMLLSDNKMLPLFEELVKHTKK